MSDTITLHVQWCNTDSNHDITGDPCAAQNADELRLHTESGEFIAIWERVNRGVGRVWNVTTSDYALSDSDREALSGYHDHASALAEAVQWFRANCGVRSDVAIELA